MNDAQTSELGRLSTGEGGLPLWHHHLSVDMLQEQPLNEGMSPINLLDAIREQIPGVDSFDSDDLNQLA